jgi:hypothetical protein
MNHPIRKRSLDYINGFDNLLERTSDLRVNVSDLGKKPCLATGEQNGTSCQSQWHSRSMNDITALLEHAPLADLLVNELDGLDSDTQLNATELLALLREPTPSPPRNFKSTSIPVHSNGDVAAFHARFGVGASANSSAICANALFSSAYAAKKKQRRCKQF